jgi:hypothetical protein
MEILKLLPVRNNRYCTNSLGLCWVMEPTSLNASSSSGAEAVGTSVLLLLPPATAATKKAKGFERLQLRSSVLDPNPVGSETFSRKKSYRNKFK